MKPAIAVALLGVFVGSALAKPDAFAAAMPTKTDVVLVGAGDIAACESDGDEATATLVEDVLRRASPQSRVFTAGDNVYPTGSADSFKRCYLPSWGRFLNETLPVAGNHDWMTPNAAGYFATFGPRAGTAETPWRSVKVGGWRVILLDSNCDEVGGCGEGSRQLSWLRNELSRSPPKCTVVIWHHPFKSSGPHGSDPRTKPLWAALFAGGADLVIAGHDHLYERFAPADQEGNSAGTGIVSFVAGTGGVSSYPTRPAVAEGSVKIQTGKPAVLMLILEDGGYRFHALSTDRNVLDSGSGRCR
jgi:3',5'-cyclic AMP phosphodiesterase CpdA